VDQAPELEKQRDLLRGFAGKLFPDLCFGSEEDRPLIAGGGRIVPARPHEQFVFVRCFCENKRYRWQALSKEGARSSSLASRWRASSQMACKMASRSAKR